MRNQPRPHRWSEVFEIQCHYCGRDIELATDRVPHHCPDCSTLLIVEWGARPTCGVRSASANGEKPP
jgi:predicted RNA-binding Zn-ribbon protein involved in translation (DUF1610 family)